MLSEIAFYGAIESGLIYALVAFSIFLSFRVLDFPDLTVDGSFPLGGAVVAICIVQGWNPWLATVMAIGAGMLAGGVTALLNVKLGILNLLASILVMTALYSVNLRIMGKPNVALLGEDTILSFFETFHPPYHLVPVIVFAVIILIALIVMLGFMKSEIGLAMRATGANPNMARAQGITTDVMIILGVAIANGMTALAGALFAQSQGSADVTMGVGVIVIGLASLIGGEAMLAPKTLLRALLGCVIGAIAYRLAIALALNADFIGLRAQDLNLVTAVLVTLAIVLPSWKKQRHLIKKQHD